MSRILLATLARAGSKGIPRKNTAMCAGKPLIQWTLDVAAGVRAYLGDGHDALDYAVLTDDPDVASLANAPAVSAFVVDEPAHLAADDATSDDALRFLVKEMEARRGFEYDYVVELMATNPLKMHNDVVECIGMIQERKWRVDSVIAVTKLEAHHPARAKKLVSNYGGPYICDFCVPEKSTQRQHLKPDAYIRASAIYAMTRAALFEVGRFGHEWSRAYVLPESRGIGIDTMADLKAAEWYLEQRKKTERLGRMSPAIEQHTQLMESLIIRVDDLLEEEQPMKILCITPVHDIDGIADRLKSIGEVMFAPKLDWGYIPVFDGVEAIFCNPNKQPFRLDAKFLDHYPGLRVICTASTGLTHIDLGYCKERGIDIISLRGDPVLERISSTAEHAFLLMLAALRHLPGALDSVARGEWDWEPFVGRQLDALTVGIVGYGRLGRMMARYCAAFDADVIVYDPHAYIPDEELPPHMDRWEDVYDVLSQCDVISLHIHAEGNEGLVDASWFDRMRPDVVLVNTSRGEVVDEAALIDFLMANPEARYAADVLGGEQEKLGPTWNMMKLDNVRPQLLITPHIGGMTREARALAYGRAVEKLGEWVEAKR